MILLGVNKMKVSNIRIKLDEYDRLQSLIDEMEKSIKQLATEKSQVSFPYSGVGDYPTFTVGFNSNTAFFNSVLIDFLKVDIIELLKEKVEELKEKQRYMEIQ
jgi:hypothetical protein